MSSKTHQISVNSLEAWNYEISVSVGVCIIQHGQCHDLLFVTVAMPSPRLLIRDYLLLLSFIWYLIRMVSQIRIKLVLFKYHFINQKSCFKIYHTLDIKYFVSFFIKYHIVVICCQKASVFFE